MRTNFSNMPFCFPIQIKSKTDKTADIFRYIDDSK